ncbi:(2Fe-2S)-binding protein [Nocardioides sp. YIM 152315]|uniref:(2Fe-2S)-binding protein n=1 Tax=Nocardioides sp. YIM 152315 TaxID=3031760 RepID=UPI0023DB8199|nr:(2Fe-2S)-binding protein [Nocardioides sp. YIM 152315]MDF1605825.1 (2Fe-2S)-binding protein [Nocardioides sp. YIM 152315]
MTSNDTAQSAQVRCTVNGQAIERNVESRMLLSDFIRHELGLTGTHVGCEHGVCGACTVLVDGDSARACLMFAAQADGTEIETVESLASGDSLSPVQQAFSDQHGLQCGFCTPGILMSLTACMREAGCNREQMLSAVGGHICRCTGYVGISRAVDQVLAEGAEQDRGTES